MSRHDSLKSVLESIAVAPDSSGLLGSIYVSPVGEDSQLIIDTQLVAPSEPHIQILSDCLQMPAETIEAVGSAMLAMHRYLADECGDLEVTLDSVEAIWLHTSAWYVIVESQQELQHRYLRFHFKADWETEHGVEVVVRDGVDVIFVGNCGKAGPLSRLDGDQFSGLNFACPESN